MLHRILNLNGVKTLDSNQKKTIHGGAWPQTEEDCYRCGGTSWIPTPLNGGLCELPWNSPCI